LSSNPKTFPGFVIRDAHVHRCLHILSLRFRYTYWDYYRQRFERNRGLRIDFVLGSPTFASRVTGAFIDRDERDPAQGSGPPSDHAPVIVDIS
jgi:exonuclease III